MELKQVKEEGIYSISYRKHAGCVKYTRRHARKCR